MPNDNHATSDETNEKLRRVLCALLERERRSEDFHALLELTYYVIEGAVNARLRDSSTGQARGDDLETELVTRFLDEKLIKETFWRSLVGAENPMGYFYKAVEHFVIDALRKRGDEIRVKAGPDFNDIVSETPTLDMILAEAERLKHFESMIASLNLDDRWLLAILHSDLSWKVFVSEEELDTLADRHGHSRAELLAGLERRSEAQWEARHSLDCEIETRGADLQRWYSRRRWIRTFIVERDGAIRSTPLKLSNEKRASFLRSRRELERATAEERLAYLNFVENTIEEKLVLQQETQKRTRDVLPAGKHYREVLRFLGQLDDTTPDADVRRLENGLNRRVTRLHQKLQRMYREQRSTHDDLED